MSVLRFPEWQKPCEDALAEPDSEKLFERVILAETAIFRRLQALTSAPARIELEAIDTMLNRLRCLVTHSFTPPHDGQEQAGRRALRNPKVRSMPCGTSRPTQPSAPQLSLRRKPG